jgi:hypothetical protein
MAINRFESGPIDEIIALDVIRQRRRCGHASKCAMSRHQLGVDSADIRISSSNNATQFYLLSPRSADCCSVMQILAIRLRWSSQRVLQVLHGAVCSNTSILVGFCGKCVMCIHGQYR